MSNPILKKEIQLLKGPIFAGAGLLALIWINHAWVSPFLLPSTTWSIGLFALLLSYTITKVFGHEIAERSFGTWLTQPKPRKELWKEKLKPTLIVYCGLSLVLGLTMIWVEAARPEAQRNEQLGKTLLYIMVASFGPGIFYGLKLRNPTASFWLTVISIPFFLLTTGLVASFIFFPNHMKLQTANFALQVWNLGLITAYGIWGLWAAKRHFLHWEDLGLGGKVLEFRFKKPNQTKPTGITQTTQKFSPVRKLIVKELRLQQLNILIGVLMFGAVWGAHYWGIHRSSRVHSSEDLQKLIEVLPNMFRYLLFILPCSITAIAIADNRRQDVHTWELMLPLSRRFQFFIKLTLCMLLGWIFAAGLPFTYDSQVNFISLKRPEDQSVILGVISIAAIVISGLSFYVSSLTSSYLKSFSFSLGLMPLMIFFLGFVQVIDTEGGYGIWPIGWFAVPSGLFLLLTLLAVGWSRLNFESPVILKHHKWINWKRWGTCGLATGVWIGIMVDRTWERMTMVEPRAKTSDILTVGHLEYLDDWSKKHLFQQPGASVINQSQYAVNPDLGEHMREASIALCRDGRMSFLNPGSLYYHRTPDTFRDRNQILPIIVNNQLHLPHGGPEMPTQARVTETETSFYHRFILDMNGGLWMWTHKEEVRFIREKSSFDRPLAIQRLNQGQRFRNLCGNFRSVNVLDENDYLWSSRYVRKENKSTGELPPFEKTFPAHQWKEIAKGPLGMLGLKEDGTLWAWDNAWINFGKEKADRINSSKLTQIFEQRKWKSIFPHNEMFLAEAEDGTMWIPTHAFLPSSYEKGIPNLGNRILCRVELPGLRQYATDRFSHPEFPFYWISEDGTLWKSEFMLENLDINTGQDIVAKPTKSRQIGRRNDWVYLTYFAGMTADGKIWNWDRIQTNRWNPFPARFRHKVVAEVRP